MNLREPAAIVLTSIAAAIGYGVVHDQFTARICVEYFTVGHPPVFETTDPTLLALGWGVLATWWVGLILGIGLACAARAGTWPQRDLRSLLRPMALLLAFMGVCALLFGVVGYQTSVHGVFQLVGPLAEQIPPHKHSAFLADGWAHGASYVSGFLGGVVLMALVVRGRQREELRGVKAASATPAAPAEDPPEGAPPHPLASRKHTSRANLVVLPQLLLAFVAAMFASATVVGDPQGSGAISIRVFGLGLALTCVGMGGLAWRRQLWPARLVSTLVSVFAGLLALDSLLRLI
jgi:hypothetical protein